MAFKYKKGLLAKDKVTGFKGIITYRVEYMTGCDQYGLSPEMTTKDKEIPKAEQFDESRIEILGEGVSQDPNFDSSGMNWDEVQAEKKASKRAVKAHPGGPQTPASQNSRRH